MANIYISKEEFEAALPVAMTKNNDVYETLTMAIRRATEEVATEILGNVGVEAVETGEDGNLVCSAKALISFRAFLRNFRSLDLVLTATGFGIVSTDSTAPASRARVDALIEEMSVERLLVKDKILTSMIMVEGWGDTEQAKRNIATLFPLSKLMRSHTTKALTTANWQEAQGNAIIATDILRTEISTEYMDELLTKYRNATLDNADMTVIMKCQYFIGDYISHAPEGKPNKIALQMIVEQLEAYTDSYPTYKSSRLYAKRHGQRYENKPEHPTFFFM